MKFQFRTDQKLKPQMVRYWYSNASEVNFDM